MRHVPEILEGWSRLTGFDPSAMSFRLGGLDPRRMAEAIRRAQDLDPGDGLALMLLEHFLDAFLRAKAVSAAEMLDDLDRHMAFLAAARDLRALIADSGLPEARAALKTWTLAALAHYGAAGRAEVIALVEDRDRLAFLRRDALDAVERGLEVHQFAQGEADGARPRLLDHVVEVTSVAALLRGAAAMPSGILVALVREPDPIHSYFVVVARNGGTLTLLTDRTRWATPFQKASPRRPERHFEDRVEQTHFPYGLLSGLTGSDEETPHGRELIAPGMAARRLCPIRDLPAHQAIWLVMLLDAVAGRYFREDRRLAQLSHLGGQLRAAPALAGGSGLPALIADSLDVAPLRSTELDAARFQAEGKADRPRGSNANAWLEARYRAQVGDAVLNLVSDRGEAPVLIGPGGARIDAEAHLKLPEYQRRDARASRMMTVEAEDFATRADLLADRILLARHNQVLEINRLAAEEFAARREEIENWWLRTLRRRKDALLAAVAAGTLPASGEAPFRHGSTCTPSDRAELLRMVHRDDKRGLDDAGWCHGVVFGDGTYAKTNWKGKVRRDQLSPSDYCVVRGVSPSWRVRFSPHDAADLAILAGVPVAKLPDVLREWVRKPDYVGNHWLDRIDPLDWLGQDPWRTLDFRVELWLSESGLTKICRQYGGPGPDRGARAKPAPVAVQEA